MQSLKEREKMCVCVCARLLGKNGKEVAFSEVECEVASVYVSGVLVLGVPGTGVRNPKGCFPRCDLLRVLHLRERIHGEQSLKLWAAIRRSNPCMSEGVFFFSKKAVNLY